jgi:RNA polymerase sigma-70 factor (ECF subfamily)
MTDFETARKIQEGDPDAISSFITLRYPEIYRLLRHLTLHAEDAEDLTQQTFLQARRCAGGYNGRASLRTWLHRIAFHEYTHWKRARRRTSRLVDQETIEERGYAACLDAIAVEQALAQLPARQREAFLLLEVQEMSIAEVAATMRVPVGTAKSRVHHARKALRAMLQAGTEDSQNERRAYECR